MDARRQGVRTVVRSAGAALVAGLLLALVGLLAAGSPAATGAGLGTAAVVLVLFSGSLVVLVVADLMPSASLVVALMTYTLQMALLALVLLPLSSTSWAAAHLDAPWLAAAVVATALVWTVSQVRLATRVRIPVYDLPDAPVDTADASAGAEGGKR